MSRVQHSYRARHRPAFTTRFSHSTSCDSAINEGEGEAGPERGALHGVRVLDLSKVLAGPYCTAILGDLGADVIKVERPGFGDDTRFWGPPFVGKDGASTTSRRDSAGGESAYFLSTNRNKRSVCIDVRTSAGRQLVLDLAASSDVLVENYLPGKMTSWGLGYEDVVAVNPSIIYCSISGFGSDGPYSRRPGYDIVAGAMGGLHHITGEPDGNPMKPGVALVDICTGLYAHGAILAALVSRGTTGEGQHVHCNLLSSQVSTLTNVASSYLLAGQEAHRWGTRHPNLCPYQAFDTADGKLVIGATNEAQFRELCKAVGLPELYKEDRFATNAERVRHRDALEGRLQAALGAQPTSHWLDRFDGLSLPYAPVNNMEQVFANEQVVHSGIVKTVGHPMIGELRLVGNPVTYDGTPAAVTRPPPLLGEHTAEVLEEVLGMDATAVAAVRRDGTIA